MKGSKAPVTVRHILCITHYMEHSSRLSRAPLRRELGSDPAYGREIARAWMTEASPPVVQTATRPESVAASTGYVAGPPGDSVMTGPKSTRWPDCLVTSRAAATRWPLSSSSHATTIRPRRSTTICGCVGRAAPERGDPGARRERATVTRRGVEERAFGIGPRRPPSATPGGPAPPGSTAIAGPSSGHPLIAHVSSLTRTGAANDRPPSRENVKAMSRMLPWVHVPPGGIHRLPGANGQCGLAAVADALGQLALGRWRATFQRRSTDPDFCAMATPSCAAPLRWSRLAPAARAAARPR